MAIRIRIVDKIDREDDVDMIGTLPLGNVTAMAMRRAVCYVIKCAVLHRRRTRENPIG